MKACPGAKFFWPGPGGQGPRAGRRDCHCALKGSQATWEHPGCSGLAQPRQGVLKHGISAFSFQLQKVQLVLENSGLILSFPCCSYHVRLSQSLPATTPGGDRVTRAGSGPVLWLCPHSHPPAAQGVPGCQLHACSFFTYSMFCQLLGRSLCPFLSQGTHAPPPREALPDSVCSPHTPNTQHRAT